MKFSQIYINIKTDENIAKQNEIVMQEMLTESKTKEIAREITKDTIEENIWQIEIPKINLVAPISEGTSSNVMNKYVGHFETTNLFEGNVGLAAHNRRI